MRLIHSALFICLLLTTACSRSAPQLRGKVIGITDGDTMKVLVGKEELMVRLEGIDAPEAKQSFGNQSKQALSRIAFGRDVIIRYVTEDRAGRTVGIVMLDGTDVSSKMIEDGWAWHYKEYDDHPHLADLERRAKASKRGLWSDPNPLPPWEYRARQKREHGEPPTLFWLNTSSNVRHNQNCEHFRRGKNGRTCSANEGRACGICGG